RVASNAREDDHERRPFYGDNTNTLHSAYPWGGDRKGGAKNEKGGWARHERAGGESNGGESGIRTHGRVSPTHAFQACSLNRSDISPREWNQQSTGRGIAAQNQTVT